MRRLLSGLPPARSGYRPHPGAVQPPSSCGRYVPSGIETAVIADGG